MQDMSPLQYVCIGRDGDLKMYQDGVVLMAC